MNEERRGGEGHSALWWEAGWLGRLYMRFVSFLRAWFWPLWKWILRLLTRRCEVVRILSSRNGWTTKQKTIAFDLSLQRSKQLREVYNSLWGNEEMDTSRVYAALCQCKRIDADTAARFSLLPELDNSLALLEQLRALIEELLGLSNQSYDSSNEEHEALLERLWQGLKPGVHRKHGRKSPEWGELGFQGTDPATDFRGMGILGLTNLVYFAENYPEKARLTLADSVNPNHEYPLAITGINLTKMLLSFLHKDLTRSVRSSSSSAKLCNTLLHQHFLSKGCSLTTFNELYSHVLFTFGRVYVSKRPENILQFPRIHDEFKANLVLKLESDGVLHF
ncbi:ELMO domain-containing protein 1 [Balamuthia mandrillaris]